jgi:hypothetical protein
MIEHVLYTASKTRSVMRAIIFLHLMLICGFAALSVYPQRPPAPGRAERKDHLERRVEREAEVSRRLAEIESRLKREPARMSKSYLPIKPKRTQEQEMRLRPSTQDLNQFASFLQQPKTGLIRLLPDSGCQSDTKIIRTAEQCASYIPGSSFYSFREREYTLEGLADVRYKNGTLISDPLYGQGILLMLGDISLDGISLEADGLKDLSRYQPATESESALKQFTELSAGVINGKYLFRNVAPLGENVTYALRVIAYRGDFARTILEEDERKDILVAFRIVRNERDNGITLLWKELSRKESPQLAHHRKAAADVTSPK